MWFDGIRQPNTLYVASVSRGKDSTAMLRAIQLMGWPLDAIVSVDIWFDEETPAELPPLAKFKDEWDAKVQQNFCMPVTRMCATQKNGEKQTYCNIFYRRVSPEREREREREMARIAEHRAADHSQHTDSLSSVETGVQISKSRHLRMGASSESLLHRRTQKSSHHFKKSALYGFPARIGPWCNGYLKAGVLDKVFKCAPERGAKDKYRSLYRHRGRRAKANCTAHCKA